MRLALPSLILFLYILFSLIIWLPCRPWVKIAMAITFFLIGLKYVIYVYLGGSFIAPGFPFWALERWSHLSEQEFLIFKWNLCL